MVVNLQPFVSERVNSGSWSANRDPGNFFLEPVSTLTFHEGGVKGQYLPTALNITCAEY